MVDHELVNAIEAAQWDFEPERIIPGEPLDPTKQAHN